MNTPRHVVAAAFAVLRANDWNGLASLCDPLSLRSFKTEMVEAFDDEAMPQDVDSSTSTIAPMELDDEQYAEYCKYFDPVVRMQNEFPKLSSVQELREMDAVDVFASWLDARSHGAFKDDDDSPDQPWESSSPWRPDNSSSRRRRGWPNYVIVGCIFDSPDIAYVLYRNELSVAECYPEAYDSWISKASGAHREFMIAMHHRGDPILITCRRQDDGSWRLVAKKHFMLFGSFQAIEIRRDE